MTGYGVPSAAPPPTPHPTGSTTAGQPLFELIGAGLGFLSFIWGFLDFYSGEKGYAFGATAVGLSIAAGAIAGAVLLSEKSTPARPPYALAVSVAALLVAFGELVGKPTGSSAQTGLYLLLITTLAQVVLFGLAYAQSSGRMKPKPSAPVYPAGPGYGQPQAGYGQAPSGYSQPAPGPNFGQPGYAQPPVGSQPATGYGQPSTYGQPQSGGYAPPPPSGPPAQPSSQPSGYANPVAPPQPLSPVSEPDRQTPGQPGGGYGQRPPSNDGYGQSN